MSGLLAGTRSAVAQRAIRLQQIEQRVARLCPDEAYRAIEREVLDELEAVGKTFVRSLRDAEEQLGAAVRLLDDT